MRKCSAPLDEDTNSVRLDGKVSQAQGVRYTPSGSAILDFTIAVPQCIFGQNSIGYFEVQVIGDQAEEMSGSIKIGKNVSVTGSLWMRKYRNREGLNVTETKIVSDEITLGIKEGIQTQLTRGVTNEKRGR